MENVENTFVYLVVDKILHFMKIDVVSVRWRKCGAMKRK